ncbi:MAG: helix-turn-helix transcriptional regulator [Oscillospiraceae bacterium]|nr:helix-turn-helix transcriptional regulator [Oscillospiraceae bacterium]
MQNETASTAFFKYGNVYRNLDDTAENPMVCQIKRIPAQQTHSQFLRFSCDTYIEVQNGIGVLLVSPDPETGPIEEFGMNQRIHIKPNVYFSFVSSTPELILHLYTKQDCQMDVVTRSTPYIYHPVLPRIRLQNILGYYYRMRTPGYHFKGEQHPFFELTYVDTGILYTEVDGVSYKLGEKDLIIYGPGQFHSQRTENQTVSYVTIMFSMENISPELPADWYSVLTNRVFPYNKKIYTLIKALVQESSSGAPYTDSLMHCLLTETIVRLLQGVYTTPTAQPSSVVRQNYQEELFDRILSYVESKLYEPLTVADICQQFSLSRSTLQILFKNAVNQSPKKYINDMKLERSCQMLRENKYTISEISLKLGYSSIHYFSNAFNQKYHISPSEYAKRIY